MTSSQNKPLTPKVAFRVLVGLLALCVLAALALLIFPPGWWKSMALVPSVLGFLVVCGMDLLSWGDETYKPGAHLHLNA